MSLTQSAPSDPKRPARSTPRTHLLLFEMPSPGWVASLDQTREGPGREDAFVTITKPSPAYVYAQGLTPVLVGTGVASDVPIQTFARVADFGAKIEPDAPYQRVTPVPQTRTTQLTSQPTSQPTTRPAQPPSLGDKP